MQDRKISAAKKRTILVAVAIILSIILYLAGVYSGLYANKMLEEKTKRDIRSFKEETEENIYSFKIGTEKEVQYLKSYINFLETNQGRLLLEKEFVETLTPDQICDFSDLSMRSLLDELNFYWQRFPFRLEEYERDNQPLSEEYLTLKQKYTQLSIRTWILAKTRYEKCGTKLVHGFNFYSANCSTCAKQGEQLDKFSPTLREEGIDVIIFTIDLYSDESVVKFLKQHYGINSTPALLLNNKLYQGRVFNSEELLEELQEELK